MPRRAVAALGLVATLMLLLGLAPAASAHDYLVSSTPEQGAQVDSPPTEVALGFNTSVGQQFAQVAVVDTDGTTYQVGAPVVEGPTVTQQVSGLARGREYTISYRVVSSDGHPIGGTVEFAVAADGGADEQPAAAEQDGAAGDEQAGTTADEQAGTTADEPTTTGDDAPAGTDETAATASSGGGVSPVVWVVGAGVLAVMGALGVGLTRRRSTTGS